MLRDAGLEGGAASRPRSCEGGDAPLAVAIGEALWIVCAWWGASVERCGAGDRPPLIDLDVPESWRSVGLGGRGGDCKREERK